MGWVSREFAELKKSQNLKKNVKDPGMMVHTYIPSTWEGEAGGSRV
jgi:hypothetical protein